MLELIFPFFAFICFFIYCLLVSSPTHKQEGTRVYGSVQWDFQDATNSQVYSFHWTFNFQLWTLNFQLVFSKGLKSFKCLVVTSFVVARFKKICERFITCFCLWSCVNCLLNNLLDLFWCPIMNIMNVHDIHSNVQVVCHDKLKNPLIIDIEVVHNDAYVIKMHLENLRKQRLLWKPHYCSSITWAFFKWVIINLWI